MIPPSPTAGAARPPLKVTMDKIVELAITSWLWLSLLATAFAIRMGVRPTLMGWVIGVACWLVPIVALVTKAIKNVLKSRSGE